MSAISIYIRLFVAGVLALIQIGFEVARLSLGGAFITAIFVVLNALLLVPIILQLHRQRKG